MLLLAAIALIAIGPKQLPEVARMIGRFLNDMKKIRDEFTRSIVEARDGANDRLLEDRRSVEQTTAGGNSAAGPAQSDEVGPLAPNEDGGASPYHSQQTLDVYPDDGHQIIAPVPAPEVEVDAHKQMKFDLPAEAGKPAGKTDPHER